MAGIQKRPKRVDYTNYRRVIGRSKQPTQNKSCQIQQEVTKEQANRNLGQATEQKGEFGFTNQDIVDEP